MRTNKRNLFFGLLLACVWFAGGCSGSRTYLLNLSYTPAKVPVFVSPSAKPVTLAVYQFQDRRPDRLYLGRRVYPDNMVDYYKPDSGTVEQIVTRSIIENLEKAGFKTKTVNRYLDPQKEDFKDIPGDAAIGGFIDTLWVEVKKSGITTWDTDAKLKLQINWGLVKDRTWINKMIEGGAQETNRPLYRPKYAEAKVNEVFRDGMEKLLKDDTILREKLQPK